jgi:O-antigen/teichoic acid export membrane protein
LKGNKLIKNITGLSLPQSLIKFFTKGHERSIKAKKNILSSFILKGLSIVLGLISMPLTIHYLEPQKYGIWITLSSLIAWFGFFDIGLGGGLRNRFAEALAQGKHELARTYVSTTYAILAIIIGAFWVLFFLINPFLPWNAILNVGQKVVSDKELKLLALIAFTTFSMSFLLRLITTILTADQRPALASIFDLIGKALSVLIIIMLIKTTQGSLLYLGIVQSCMPVLVLMLSSFWFFRGKYKKYRPSLSHVEFGRASDLLNLGIKFFILNIAVLLLYQTNNIVIAQLFGPKEVTTYNVAYTYYGVLTMGFGIIITPFWSAFTEAWVKKEISWIKNMMRNLIFLWVALVLVGILMVVSSQWIFAIWIGNRVHVPYLMSFLVCTWVLLNAWNGIYSSLLNGVGKIKLQMYLGISAAIINVPLAIFLGKAIGIEGILLANVLLTLAGVFIYPLQYKNIINNNTKWIWNQ